MPPRRFSRHALSDAMTDDGGLLFLTEREPFRYRPLPDNRLHVVVAGDTLFHLAGRYFAPIERACGLWWVIADFQPQPVHDPTIALVLGSTLVIPSVRTVLEDVFSERRRTEEAS